MQLELDYLLNGGMLCLVTKNSLCQKVGEERVLGYLVEWFANRAGVTTQSGSTGCSLYHEFQLTEILLS